MIRPAIVTFWFGSSREAPGVTWSMLIRAQDSGSAACAVGAPSSGDQQHWQTDHRDQQGRQHRPSGAHLLPHVTRWIVVIGPG